MNSQLQIADVYGITGDETEKVLRTDQTVYVKVPNSELSESMEIQAKASGLKQCFREMNQSLEGMLGGSAMILLYK